MFLLWYFEIFNKNMLLLKVIYVHAVNVNFFNRIFTGNSFFLSSIFLFLAKLNHGNLLESSAWQVIMVAVHKKVDNFDLHTSYFLSIYVLYLYCWWLCSVVSSTAKMSSLLCNMLRKRPSCWYYLQSVISGFFIKLFNPKTSQFTQVYRSIIHCSL